MSRVWHHEERSDEAISILGMEDCLALLAMTWSHDLRDAVGGMRKPVVVLGLGNPLMGDEGIGVYLVERLMESADEYPSVDFIDAGTGGLSILHHIEDRRKAIIIDCAFMAEQG